MTSIPTGAGPSAQGRTFRVQSHVSPIGFNRLMASQRMTAEAVRRASRLYRNLGEDIRRLREDAGINRARLAGEAGIDLAYLCRIEDGAARPSIDVLSKLALPLGADLSGRFYPTTGPVIRDRHQARILEALLAELHPRWRTYVEVGVRHPARGWIDVLMHAAREGYVVATEIESTLPRIEQLLRWLPEKVASLPSWEGWGQIESAGDPSRLLVVRSTRTTRTIGRDFERQLAAAYPAHPADALSALTGTSAWPGPALIWAEIEADRVRFISRR